MPGRNSRTEIVLLGEIYLGCYFPSCACESHLTQNSVAKSLLLDGSACSSSSPNYAHYFHDTNYYNLAKIPIFCYPRIEKAHRRGWHDSFIFCSPSDTHHFYLAFFALLRAHHITNTKSRNPSRRLTMCNVEKFSNRPRPVDFGKSTYRRFLRLSEPSTR